MESYFLFAPEGWMLEGRSDLEGGIGERENGRLQFIVGRCAR